VKESEHFSDFSFLIITKEKNSNKTEDKVMKKQAVIIGSSMLALILSTNVSYAKKWNNPENEKRYHEALRRSSDAYRNESRAWQNYDRPLERAQKDVRRVLDEAIRGAVKSGVPGAAWGEAKGAAIGIGGRGRDYLRNR